METKKNPFLARHARWPRSLWRHKLLTVLLAILLPAVAGAEENIGNFANPSEAFTCYAKGQDCMRLKLQLTTRLDDSNYRDLKDCNFYLKDEKGTIYSAFFVSETATYDGTARARLKNMMSDESIAFLSNDNSNSPYFIVRKEDEATYVVKNNGGYSHPDTYVEIDWYYPIRFSGKKFKLGVAGKVWVGGSKTVEYNREDICTVEFPKIGLEAYDPVPSYEDESMGTLLLPVVCDRNINWMEVSYQDSLGINHSFPRITYTGNSNYSDFISLPSYEAHKNTTIKANFTTTIMTEVLPDDAPKSFSGTATFNLGDVAMVHGPQWLHSTTTDDGAVELKWKISDVGFKDAIDGDQFVIERSLTGKDEDFNIIAVEMFDKSQRVYTYKDSLLVSSLTPELIDKSMGIPLVRYRVYRAAAQAMWGYDKNPAQAYVQPQFSTLSLLMPKNAEADWSDGNGESERNLTVTWQYEKNNYSTTYVWDSRAEMVLDVKAYNKAGELVETTSTILNSEQRESRKVELTLGRSCVSYELHMRVDAKTSPIGKGTGDIFVQIENSGQFTSFVNRVYNGETGLNAILTRDFDTSSNTTIASRADKPYTGNFNGNGHTINISYLMHSDHGGLFRFAADGAVISNLKVTGTITSPGTHVGGLVGSVQSGTVHIENCSSTITIDSGTGSEGGHGGLVGNVADGANLRISNSMFHGRMHGSTTSNCGGIVGWRGSNSFVMISNTFFNPLEIYLSTNEGHATFVRSPNGNTDYVWSIIEDCFYKIVLGTPQGYAFTTLAKDNWCWPTGEPESLSMTFSTPTASNETEVQTPEHQFYFSNSGRVDQNSLTTKTLQSSVLLEWKSEDDGVVDYYEVLRKEKEDKTSDYTVIASQINDLQYEDKTAKPRHTYLYKVRSAVDCEGLNFVESQSVEGKCVETCMIEGYVRFGDGTGVPGVSVTATPDGLTDATSGGSATTNESGYYCIKDLPYWNVTTGAYNITTNYTAGEIRSVEFDDNSNHAIDKNFTVTNSIKFSGFVMFEGTSIPVQDVGFKVDGREVMTSAGKVLTDFKGAFAFRMLPGNHTIQAFKEDHTFWQEGFYMDGDSKDVELNTDRAQTYFYDQTRVKLIGRVAGGKDQGDLPLGYSLSKNNLGDNLKIVMSLEGDNTSWLVFENTDTNLKERDEEFENGHPDQAEHKTKVHYTRHRLEIMPDPKTGEYHIELPPVKWKITQITAQGYPTLFQNGQTGDVIDLTDALKEQTDHYEGAWTTATGISVKDVDVTYNAIYNRIYHTPVKLNRQQLSYDTFDYFGDRYYNASDLSGNKAQVTLVRPVLKKGWPEDREDAYEAEYTFGYPVFNAERTYPILISATETYYYNNDELFGEADVVKLSGGVVTVQNGLAGDMETESIELDDNGEAIYKIKAKQIPFLLTGDHALRTLTITLLMDGTYYEAEPLKAYVMNLVPKKGAKDLLSINKPILIDILRDPPGGASSAKLSKGSQYNYSFSLDYSFAAGANPKINLGTSWNTWQGVGAGVYTKTNNWMEFGFNLVFNENSKKAYNYTMTTTADISTSSNDKMVGADADVYIGTENIITMTPAIAIRAIPNDMYQRLKGEEAAGRLNVIAQSTDENGEHVYLVRDEIISYGTELKSTFAHSQQYILNQLIPELEEQCKALMFMGSKDAAKQQANATGKPVYMSLRQPGDPDFAVINTTKNLDAGDEEWEYYYNTQKDRAEEGINYLIVLPDYYDSSVYTDEVELFSEAIFTWYLMVAQNEHEKLTASTRLNNFDLDGGSPLAYSEEFGVQRDQSESSVNIATNFIYGDDVQNEGQDIILACSIVKGTLSKLAQQVLKKIFEEKSFAKTKTDDHDDKKTVVEIGGVNFSFDPGVVWKMDFTPKYGETIKMTRKESFTISMDRKSHLDFDVFYSESSNTTDATHEWNDVFYNGDYYDMADAAKKNIFNSHNGLKNFTPPQKRGFIYRTRGGATCRPYEGERTTKVYKPGTVLDERTKKIENPVITMDKQSVSGVPMGEPARFKVYLANESEQPEAVHPYWELVLKETTNPNGAKVMMDGMPLSGNPRVVEIVPGTVTEKAIEVFAGEEFDYENIGLRLRSQGDIHTWADTEFSVHFLHTAGGISIASPGDKWIMNTDAPFDEKHGWYMPVIISGFDKNQHNFDHIEFQYKETTRGDDYWVNLCGFYKDQELYDAASGTKEMIPENGYINTRFYGDGNEMEKGYDLRAVLFCRHGNDYLTNSSTVLSGVKDTRRPRLFGSVEPKDGILGSGDNIIFNFSENIEHNYLSSITNFEVVGETNETVIQEEPSLDFRGKCYAASQTRRNFTDKSVSIDVMVRPDKTGEDMPVFSHGTDGHNLQLWIMADGKLKAVVDEKTLLSRCAIDRDYLNQIVMVLDNSAQKLYLYNDSLIGSMDDVTYSGYGTLIFGSTNQSDVSKRSFYKGHMLEARVWNRVLDKTLIDTYGRHQLTGYEMGLIDYYPMNEGEGQTAVDLSTGGADLTLTGAAWALPRGMSLHLDGAADQDVKGLQLKTDFIARTSEQDYTLMFWFRTDSDGRGALLSNGSGQASDVNAADRFFIGFEGETLKYRSNGQEYKLGDNYSDDAWHHYAMTVNRSYQVCNIYVDNVLKASFMTDKLGGMTGNNFFLGNMVWQEEGEDPNQKHYQNAFTGYIDELCLFKQALPTTLIKRYSRKSPRGNERGLVTYMGFNRQERTKQNDLELFPYALNQVITTDEDGVERISTDSVFVNPTSEIISLIDKSMGAPVQPFQELKNLNFSFVGRDNQLLVNIDELDSKINKCTIHVTVAEIPDKNGNYMASPGTESFFVNRNPLRWKTYNYVEKAFYGIESYMTAYIVNTSGAEHTYTLEGVPRWMSVNAKTNVIGPQETQELIFVISDEVNVGVYDEVIYLVDENGLAEPLRMEIVVEDSAPEWYVFPDTKLYSMIIVGQVSIGDAIVANPEDLVAAFDEKGRCMGVAHVDYNTETGLSMVYLTVYNSEDKPEKLKFRLWHYDTGKTMLLTTSNEIRFGNQAHEGTVKEPVRMTASDMYIQRLELSAGWNWISFNVKNDSMDNIESLLSMFNWQDGDIVTEDSQDLTLSYKNGQWMSNSKSDISQVSLSTALSYRVKTQYDIDIDIEGTSLKQPAERRISVRQGWNSIGYTPLVNLPVATALAEYWSFAKDGDIIKSRDAFAQFYEGSDGATAWMGSLKYMKPGEGYMLYRQKEGSVTFRYPYYEPGSTTIDNVSHAPRHSTLHRTTMTIVAEAVGVDLQEGDRLVAYAGGEMVGEAVMTAAEKPQASEPLFFLNIAGEQEVPLSFTIERDDEIVATTGNVMSYQPDGINGSPSHPTQINFVATDQMLPSEWYSVQGFKLAGRPTMRGIYIYKGKKVIK